MAESGGLQPVGSPPMIPNDFTVATADWANDDDRNACRHVREQVYIVEQKVREASAAPAVANDLKVWNDR